MGGIRSLCSLTKRGKITIGEKKSLGAAVPMRSFSSNQSVICLAYVASSRDLTYSPAVTTSYLLGDSGVTQVGMGWKEEEKKELSSKKKKDR